MYPKRSVAVVGDSTDQSLIQSLDGAFLSHTFVGDLAKNASADQILSELENLEVDLVILCNPSWLSTSKDMENLLYGYENGARVTVARRPADFLPSTQIQIIQNLWLFIFFGAKRKDPSSPVRLYDKEAFIHILKIAKKYQEIASQKIASQNELLAPYLLSAIEHFLTFRTVGVKINTWKPDSYGSQNGKQNTYENAYGVATLLQNVKHLKSAMRSHRVETKESISKS